MTRTRMLSCLGVRFLWARVNIYHVQVPPPLGEHVSNGVCDLKDRVEMLVMNGFRQT